MTAPSNNLFSRTEGGKEGEKGKKKKKEEEEEEEVNHLGPLVEKSKNRDMPLYGN